MGNSRYVDKDFTTYSHAASTRSRDEIFTRRVIDPSLDPAKIAFREAVDSEANPETTPIILGCDETGSMGALAETIIRHGLGTIMRELYARKPVTDPQIMCMGIGDAYCDQAPLQVTQFEAAVEPMVQQITSIYLEGQGGGNPGESYTLAWYFAAHKTKCDAFTKRHRKGYLFTIGDEAPLPVITRDQLKRFLGVDAQHDVEAHELLSAVEKNWHVFHLIVKPVVHQPVEKSWRTLLGQRAILVPDIEKLAEGIVAIIQMTEGAGHDTVIAEWADNKALDTVRKVTAQLVAAT
jgi:hypothetical protein